MRAIGLRSATRIVLQFDLHYQTTDVPLESSPELLIDFATTLVGRPLLLSIVWTTTEVRIYLDSVLTHTKTMPWTVSYPGMAFVFGQFSSAPGTLMANNTIMQTGSWKGNPLVGDLGVMAQFLNVTEEGIDEPVDTNPDQFVITPETGVATSATVDSDPVTFSGFNTETTLIVSDDALVSINGGDFAVTDEETTVSPGDVAIFRTTAPSSAGTSINITVQAGLTVATWVVSTAAATGVTDFSDNFNRDDENVEANANWTRVDGSAGMAVILGNRVKSTTALSFGAAYQCPDLGDTDQYVQAKFQGASAGGFICCHLTDFSNYIGLRYNSSGLEVYKRVAGTLTQMATYSHSFSSSVTFRLETDGATFSVKANGVALTPATGSETITSGPASSTRQGFVVRGGANYHIDDFQAGTL